MILRTYEKKDLKNVKRLFISAFPPEERPPFFVLKGKLKNNSSELLIAEDQGIFKGFLYLVTYKDLMYLFFFAVEKNFRGKGVGSKILSLLKEKYKDKRIFLAREQLTPDAPNYEERVNRYNFYVKNGFFNIPFEITEGPVTFDAMGTDENIFPEEYLSLMNKWLSPYMKLTLKIKANKKECK